MEDEREMVENNVAMEKPMECSDVEEDSTKSSAECEGYCSTIWVIGNLSQNETAIAAARSFGSQVNTIDEDVDLTDKFAQTSVFVLPEFSGPLFDLLKQNRQRILGPTALQEILESGGGIPALSRPLYCQSMAGVVVCFTGIRKREELARLFLLVHNMGGSVRAEMNAKVTHLIANCCGGEKYQYATLFRLPIVSVSWVHHCWAMRDTPGYTAVSVLSEHKLKVFHGARVCFLGFPEEEYQHMADVLAENGGVTTDLADPACTHVVCEKEDTIELLERSSSPLLNNFRTPSSRHHEQPDVLEDISLLESTPSGIGSSSTTPVLKQGEGSTRTGGSRNRRRLSTAESGEDSPRGAKLPRLSRFQGLVRRSLRLLDTPPTLPPPPPPPPPPVVDESATSVAPAPLPPRAHLVKAEWFWASVQKEYCVNEEDHLFQEYVGSTPVSHLPPAAGGSSRGRKRKRLRTNLGLVISPAACDLQGGKRRSSITDATLLSCSGSFLDSSPAQPESEGECLESPHIKNITARRQVFLELVQTESNYVGILNTIMTLFKGPLEDMLEDNDPLLNATELKIIFGNLPPIHQTHCIMLEELRYAAQNWTEEISIGNIILKFSSDLVKAYPPFVNFFEASREMLLKCDSSKPRFHAFLKARQTRAECGRQTLVELLIRPVQRLPSISLLLNDILKHTNESNPDRGALEQALSSIREVMTHINEDKRKTEGQVVMFDIFNDIDNCPPHLVSSHRSFVSRCEVVELTDGISGRGDPLVLFLFTDVLEVCKKRSKAFNSLKSPNPVGKLANGKHYKHIKLLSLSAIKKVFDIMESEACHNVFSLACREDMKEKFFTFAISDEETEKSFFLKTLCRHIANLACRADAENFFAVVDSQNLNIDTSEVGLGTLGKAFKFASRTRLKVGRAFSFNKTPSKLKRAVSTMMSPFGSTTNLSPAANQLAQMRLASCTNISELANNNSPPVAEYVAPLSVQPTRRAKHSSLSVASLRRL